MSDHGDSERFQLSDPVRALIAETTAIRRDLHAHPELGFQERRTAAVVVEHLQAAGLEVESGIAQTGVTATVHGQRPGKTLLIRADMDALPLTEERSSDYVSAVPGVMHACGHDGHVAMAITAAKVLASQRDRLAGSVKFCFQPAEEGPGGAEPMIAAGVLDGVDAAVGVHIWNDLDAGKMGVGTGPMLAAADQFSIEVVGVGGHGAYPHHSVDPLLVAAQIVVALQTIVSRQVSPLQAAVVTVGTLNAGTNHNIIPRTARLTGTLRSYRDDLRTQLCRRVQEIAEGVAGALGARARVELVPGYPATVNDAEMSAFGREVAATVFGAAGVIEPEPSMGAEDMSYYLRKVPGTFAFLGSRNPDRGLDAPHHSPLFEFDESVMPAGVEFFVRFALDYLR